MHATECSILHQNAAGGQLCASGFVYMAAVLSLDPPAALMWLTSPLPPRLHFACEHSRDVMSHRKIRFSAAAGC